MKFGFEVDDSYDISSVEINTEGRDIFQLVDGDMDILRDNGVEASDKAWEFIEKVNLVIDDGNALYQTCREFGATMHPEDVDCQMYVKNGLHIDKPITLEFTDSRDIETRMEFTPFTKCDGVFMKVESEKNKNGKWDIIDRSVTLLDGEVLGNVLNLEMEPVEKVKVEQLENGEDVITRRVGKYSPQPKKDYQRIASSLDILTKPGCIYLEEDKLTAYLKVKSKSNGREFYLSYTEGNKPMYPQYDTGMLEVRDLELVERFQMNFKETDPHFNIYKELTDTIEIVKKNDGKPFYTEGLDKPVNLYDKICQERIVNDKKEFIELFNRFNPEHAMLEANNQKVEKKEKMSLRPKQTAKQLSNGLDRES